MLRLGRALILFFALLLLAESAPGSAPAGDVRREAVTVDRAIRFRRGASSALVSGAIRRGQEHWYRVAAGEGREMTVVLQTKGRASFTVYTPEGPARYAEGETMWHGMLLRTGEYLIQVGAETNSAYNLEVWVK